MTSQPPSGWVTDPAPTLHIRGHTAHLAHPTDQHLTWCGCWWRTQVAPGAWPLCPRCRALHRATLPA